MTRIGKIAALWRYPVSSLRGEQLDEVRLDGRGVAGDRVWGLFDAAGAIASPDNEKRWRPVPELRSRLSGDGIEIAAVGDEWFGIGGEEAARAAEAVLGFPVKFQPYEGDWSEDAPTTPAPRYERANLHMLTTASLRRLQELVPDGVEVDVRRFRPNILVETEAGLGGFVEKEWIGRTLAIGDVRVAVTEPCARCSFVALAQAGLSFAPPVLHAITRHGAGGFGVLAAVEAAGLLHVGDEIALI
ncbi:MOSC domain-containing protein [Pseudaminobacter soli (ex Li et al. 2025)]|uniref:MOSC domain-containing protein n=1 Tax=Pseudaminobacter soli (ex Li et al. 2025) TaxID=1295366 RepID=A0A2P7SN47_9HYPH|nr:MOSC domain-containing protein [Mesorhizobium soli]PSJ63916.1 MOSC domain-containing protein [Mesorhizobium soli]